MGMTLAGCNPNFNDDSSVNPDVPGSSEDSSHSGGSSGGGSASEDSSESEGGDSESESGGGDSSESSEEPTHTHTYPSTPQFVADPDYMSYRKGYNDYHCTYPGCDEVKREIVYYTKAEMLTLMNTFINGKTYFDLFEAKQDLINNNYPIVDALTESTYFGYDLDNNRIALSSDTSVSKFVSFREKVVNNMDEIEIARSNIDADASSYSSIKLARDIDVGYTIAINSQNPIEVNLNGHILNNTMNNEPAIKISKGNATKPVVAIKNGTIQTKELSGFDMNKSPACVSLIDADKVRISNVTLNNRAERGYAYIDFASKVTNASVKINNSTINSKIVAICIQTNTNNIKDNNINGVVVVNGGTSTFTGNTIDATNVQKGLDQEANRLITCQELYEKCEDVYVTENRNTYMLTSTDAILIYDRRSTSSTYANPEVTITNNTLKCKVGTNNTPYGYAVRYMDLNFDPNLTSNSNDLGLIIVDNNTCTYCSSDEPLNQAGGYIYWEAE